MDPDETLSINPEFLRTLILKLRALMAQEELVSPDSGSNPSDDEGPATAASMRRQSPTRARMALKREAK